jgi:cytochrome c biogenesis factor
MNIRRLVWIIAAAIVILIVNVGLSVLYMVVYSYLINPGHDERFYQEHIKVAAPYCSIVFGIPLFYFVCRWISGKWEKDFAVKSAISVWIFYALIDVIIAITAGGLAFSIAGLMTVSLITKLISAYFGGLSASKKLD